MTNSTLKFIKPKKERAHRKKQPGKPSIINYQLSITNYQWLVTQLNEPQARKAA
jgi:hypothetical protein